MPLYEYECKKCHHRFEKIQKFSDRMVKKCPNCGGPVEQMISAPAVQFKGSGWYVTDYAKKSPSQSSSDGSGKDSGKEEKSNASKTNLSSLSSMLEARWKGGEGGAGGKGGESEVSGTRESVHVLTAFLLGGCRVGWLP